MRISVESFPEETFTGTVDLMSGELEPETRTLKVWVRVPNPDGKLRPNMRATLNIVTEQADSVVGVSHSAVLGEAGNLFVFVQSDDDGLVYEKRPVVTGIKDDRYIEIIEGVFPSDKVVTLGNYQLQYVTTRKAPAKPASGGAGHTDEHGAADTGKLGALRGPLTYMGGAIIVLLFLNLIAVLVRKRGAAPASAPLPAPRAEDRPHAATK